MDWYTDVLGMKELHPDFKMPVRWLYLGDEDVASTIGGADVSENGK